MGDESKRSNRRNNTGETREHYETILMILSS